MLPSSSYLGKNYGQFQIVVYEYTYEQPHTI